MQENVDGFSPKGIYCEGATWKVGDEIMQKIPFANLLTADSSPSPTPIYIVFGMVEFEIEHLAKWEIIPKNSKCLLTTYSSFSYS